MVFRLTVFSAFIVAFIISFLLTPVTIRLAPKIGAMDVPTDERRMHTKPTPQLGGLAIALGTIISIFVINQFIMPNVISYLAENNLPIKIKAIESAMSMMNVAIVGGILILIVGLFDDIKGLSPIAKFLCQVACASVVYALGLRITLIFSHTIEISDLGGNILSYVITVIWIVGITNAINLIDGLDGLAAGVAAIACVSIAYTAYIHGMYAVTLAMLAVAGSAVGFLPYNFNPAKTFMGDSGSLFIGFMLASISITGPTKSATMVATIIPVLVLGLPIFDVMFAILRRIINKKPIMLADKSHLHHKLLETGFGVRRSVLMLYGISGIMGITAILFSRDLVMESLALFLIAVLFILILVWDWNRNDKN